MYKYLLLLFIFLLNAVIYGQNIDSLETVLSKSSGNQKIDVLIELSIAHAGTDNSAAKSYADQAIKLSRLKKYAIGEILGLNALANYEIKIGEYQASIKNSTRALQLFEKQKEIDLNPGIIHKNLALSLTQIGAYSAAIDQRKLQYREKLKFDPTIDVNVYYLQQGVGSLYLQLENYDSAIVYFKYAQKIAQHLNDKRLYASSNNDIGWSYLKNNQSKKALGYFEAAKKSFSNIQPLRKRDSLLIGYIKSNIAECLDSKNPLAKQYFNEFIETTEQYGNENHIVQSYIQYAEFLVRTNNPLEALIYLEKGSTLIDEQNIKNTSLSKFLYRTYVQAYLKSGNLKKSEEYLTKHLHLEDSLYGVKGLNNLLLNHSDYQLARIENELKLEKFETEIKNQKIESLNTKNEISALRVTILIIAIFFIVLISIFFYVKIKNDNRRKQKAQELENKLLEIENTKTTERLTQSVLGLQRKKEFAEELISRISEIRGIEKKDINAMKLYINNELDIDESVIEMETFISETGKDFFVNLSTIHPDLTEADIKFTALIRMNLSIKQISVIKNITPQSVKIAKNRLSKKLNLEPGSSIYDYLMTL